MRKKLPALLAFIALCLMAIGGGNMLRQQLNPDEVYEKNETFAAIGRVLKGMLRGTGPIRAADVDNWELVEYGSQVYTAQCAECHGAKREGEPDWKTRKPDGVLPAPPHDETGHTWHHSDELLFEYTQKGGQALMPEGVKSGMPGFGDLLNERDIWAVISFIKSTWPKEIQERQERMNAK